MQQERTADRRDLESWAWERFRGERIAFQWRDRSTNNVANLTSVTLGISQRVLGLGMNSVRIWRQKNAVPKVSAFCQPSMHNDRKDSTNCDSLAPLCGAGNEYSLLQRSNECCGIESSRTLKASMSVFAWGRIPMAASKCSCNGTSCSIQEVTCEFRHGMCLFGC